MSKQTIPYSSMRSARRARRTKAETPSERAFDLTLWLLMLTGWAILALMVLGGVGFLLGVVIVPAVGAGAPFVLIPLLVLVVAMLSALRRRRAHAVIAYVEQATRLNLPVSAMLHAAEKSESVMTARSLRFLRLELESGQSLQDAAIVALPGLSPRVLGLIGSAERSGRLPYALGRIVRQGVSRFSGPPGNELFLRWYPLMLAMMMTVIVTGIYVFVMPKYSEIFQDFGTKMPAITVWVGRTYEWLMIPLVVLLVIVVGVYIGQILASILAPRTISWGLMRWFTDRVAWHMPGVAASARWRALADTCNVLADAMEAGHPLDRALVEASRSGTNAVLAERLARWADHTRAGQPIAEGARKAKMPHMLVGLLRTAGGADAHNLFRFLARYYDSRFARSAVLLQAAAMPALALVGGAIVCTIVLSLFLPMIELVNHITHQLDPTGGSPGMFR